MNILGLSFGFHDASAALLVGGRLVGAAAEERFTLTKHDANFPREAIDFCLRQAGLRADEIDLVCFYEEPETKLSRVLAASLQNFPFSLKNFFRVLQESGRKGLSTRAQIGKYLDLSTSRILTIPHHLSHAGAAFYSSPFSEAAVLTVDGVGEWTSTALFRGSRGKAVELEPLESVSYPNSLGLFYSAFTSYLGFPANHGECSTMALAAFGKPSFQEAVGKVLLKGEAGRFSLEPSYFDFTQSASHPVTKKFRALFGEPRDPSADLPFDCLGAARAASPHADLAASVQQALEERLLALAARAKELTGAKNLCLGGGVALNCVAVQKLIESKLFEEIFVPLDPGDGGAAIGAAMVASRREGFSLQDFPGPYLGEETFAPGVVEFLNGRSGLPKVNSVALAEDELYRQTAALLAQGKVVGWFQGRFEFGPRALGNRSLLCGPDKLEAVERLRAGIKSRARFRPFALSVAAEDAGQLFAPVWVKSLPCRYMQSTAPVLPAMQAKVRGALHIDGSTRPQICGAKENPRFHGLLAAYGKETGLGALLNTSFNGDGLPLVSTVEEALLFFSSTDLDALVIHDQLLVKS